MRGWGVWGQGLAREAALHAQGPEWRALLHHCRMKGCDASAPGIVLVCNSCPAGGGPEQPLSGGGGHRGSGSQPLPDSLEGQPGSSPPHPACCCSVPDNFSAVLELYTCRGLRVIALACRRLESKYSWHKVQHASRQVVPPPLPSPSPPPQVSLTAFVPQRGH